MKVTPQIPEYELVAPKEAVIAWKHNAVTQQVVETVRQEIQNSNQRVGQGETLGDNIIQETARAVGYVEGLKFLEIIMDVANFIEDSEDAQDERKEKSSNAVR